MRRLIAAIVISAAGALPALGDPDCRCRGSDGQIFHEGDLACIKTAKGPKLARCEMALNNTTWTVVRDDCPTAMATPLTRHVAFTRLTVSLRFPAGPGEDHADLP
jgi:hypothetical protein